MNTGFYFAGALAFLIALLGWGDQIRGAQEKTRLLEKELLEKHNFRWSELQPLIRPDHQDGPTERLASVLRILNAGGLTNSFDVNLLTQLESLNKIRLRLERRYYVRFWVVFVTSVEMLLAGILSTVLKGYIEFSIPFGAIWTLTINGPIEWNHIWSGGCIVLVTTLLYQTWRLNLDEERLRREIGLVDDQLRRAKDEKREGSI